MTSGRRDDVILIEVALAGERGYWAAADAASALVGAGLVRYTDRESNHGRRQVIILLPGFDIAVQFDNGRHAALTGPWGAKLRVKLVEAIEAVRAAREDSQSR